MVFDDHGTAADACAFTAERPVRTIAPRHPRLAAFRPASAPAVVSGRTTLKNSISCTGIGLHSGERATMTLHPATPGTGVVFRRTDRRNALIPALWTHVRESLQCTVVGDAAGNTVATIEHLMAALAALGVDDVLIEIDGPEVPAMDGSAAPFVFLIECAGVATSAAPRSILRVLKPVRVEHNGAVAELVPDAAAGLSLSFEIEFAAAAIGRQTAALTLSPHGFKEEISRARTFGLVDDLPRMRAAGLAKGGSLDNAVVVNGADVLNDGGLRYPDEFVRHKILDAVGDLALTGRPIFGAYHGVRASHALNAALVNALLSRPDAWTEETITTASAADTAPHLLRASA